MKAIFRRLLFGTALAVVLTSAFNASAFYNTSLGRWASRDPIGERGGINLYGFAHNDGVSKHDLLGKCVAIAGGKIGDGDTFRFQDDDAITEVSVSVEDADYCKAGEIKVVFGFLSDYGAGPSEVNGYGVFTCNGVKALAADFSSPPSESGFKSKWAVTCPMKLEKCNSHALGITLGLSQVADGHRVVEVGKVNASITFACDCPCKQNGCTVVQVSATGAKK